MSGKRKFCMAAAGTAAYLFLGFMYVWSVVRIELARIYPGLSASQLSLSFSIMMICFCLGGFFGGRLVQKKTPALSMRIGAALIAAGYLGASLMELFPGAGLALLYVFYAAFAGFGTGMCFNACLCNISPWFPGHVGLVTGIMLMGFGMSSFAYAFVIDALCPVLGIFGIMRLAGAVIAAVVIAASFFVKKPPVAETGTGAPQRGASPKQMVSSASFWIYFIWNTVSGAAGLLVINNAANIAAYFGLAASLGLVVSVFNGCGRPFVGVMVDRLGQFRSMLVMVLLLIAAAGMLICADTLGAGALMFAGMIIIGIIYGGGSTISAKVVAELYGPRCFGVNHSIANFCVIPASLIGPYISGILQDRGGGGFSSTFVMLLIMGAAELVLLLALYLAVKKERKMKIAIDIQC